MSLWIRKRSSGRQWSYFAVEVPIGLIPAALAVVLVVLLGYVVDAPIQTLLFCFAIAIVGAVFIAASKWTLLRQGCLLSFGSTGMSRGARVLYRVGWLLLAVGTATTLFGVAFVLRR